jgi:hypothetical protein
VYENDIAAGLVGTAKSCSIPDINESPCVMTIPPDPEIAVPCPEFDPPCSTGFQPNAVPEVLNWGDALNRIGDEGGAELLVDGAAVVMKGVPTDGGV